MESFTVSAVMATIVQYGLKVVGAVVLFIVGMWAIGKVKKYIHKIIAKIPKLDETLAVFMSSLAYYTLVVLLLISILGWFGIPVASFAALLAAAGLAIGLSLQGTLSHFAAGVMLMLFRPFKLGNVIEVSGHIGKVHNIGIFTTELVTPDNRKVILSNSNVWAGSIINYNAFPQRRLDLVFGISYADDIDKALKLVTKVVSADKKIIHSKKYDIFVDNLGDSSVDLGCRVWVKSGDYFAIKWDITKLMKQEFDKNNITIPFNTITIDKAD